MMDISIISRFIVSPSIIVDINIISNIINFIENSSAFSFVNTTFKPWKRCFNFAFADCLDTVFKTFTNFKS